MDENKNTQPTTETEPTHEVGKYTTAFNDHFDFVGKRIKEKMEDYDGYDFSTLQTRALNIFFDLSQELRGRDVFYTTCMAIPRMLFNLESAIYLLEDEDTFSLAGCTKKEPWLTPLREWDDELSTEVVPSGDRLFIPIRCNPEYSDLLPFEPPDGIIGNFVIHPITNLTGDIHFFLEKYVNRLGFKLHHRIIRARNRDHIQFIKSLVQDIGHNVIVPNMYYKLYFNRMRRKIEALHLQSEVILTMLAKCGRQDYVEAGNELARNCRGIDEQFREIYSHYETTSMFLETLLRRRHFEEGRYVLEKRSYDLKGQIIDQQLEHYDQRFQEQDIQVVADTPLETAETVQIEIDRGLMSQVFANLFSNAAKYTEVADLPEGGRGKRIWYGWERLNNGFGPGRAGLNVWLVSTGPELELKQPSQIFEPGFRGNNVGNIEGTGHGLYFIRQVVELHGGRVSYRHTDRGNEFSMLLPLDSQKTE